MSGYDDTQKSDPVNPPQDWMDRFPELSGLFGNHLFEDWPPVYETPADAVADYIDDHDVPRLRAALAELDEMMTLGLSDKELHDVLFHGLGNCYHVSGQTHAEWLREVDAQLREALQARAIDATRSPEDGSGS